MNRILTLACVLGLTGCTLGTTNDSYDYADAAQPLNVERVVVVTSAPATIKAPDTLGPELWGGAGAATIAWTLGASDPIIAGAALLGVAGAYAIEDLIGSQHEGYTYVLRCIENSCVPDREGRRDYEWAVGVVQDGDAYPAGTRLYAMQDLQTLVIRFVPIPEGE